MKTIKQFILITTLLLFSSASYAQMYNHTILEDITVGSLSSIIKDLDGAVKGDSVIIVISSPGGSVYEMIQILSSMEKTKADTYCGVPDYAASAAAIIFQYCDYRLIEDDAFLVFHFSTNSQTGLMDIPRDFNLINPDSFQQLMYKVMTTIFVHVGVKDLLTGAEWDMMIQGSDIFVMGHEYKYRGGDLSEEARLNHNNKMRSELYNEV